MQSIFAAFQQGFEGGHALARQRRADNAARSAAERYRAGDFAGAESAFLDEGMIPEAGAIGDLGERHRARQSREAIRLAMTGDAPLAERLQRGQTAALEQGDFDVASTLQGLSSNELARARENARTMAGAFASLTELPQEQRAGAALQLVQQMPSIGFTPEQVQALAPEFWSDENLTRMAYAFMDVETQANLRYQRERDVVEDERWERAFAADERHRAFERSRSSSQLSNTARRFRLDWERSQEDFTQRRDGLQRLMALRDQSTGPGAISFIFTYMKMLDPTSVVREGEYATAANAGGVSETVRNAYNRALRGDALSPDIRDQYISAARSMFEAAREQHERDLRYWRGQAEIEGVDPEVIRRLDEIETDRGGADAETSSGFPDVTAADAGRVWVKPDGTRWRWTGDHWEQLVDRRRNSQAQTVGAQRRTDSMARPIGAMRGG